MENPQILWNTPQDSRTDYRPVQRKHNAVFEQKTELQDTSKIMTGVKQGCVLSPLLFTLVMDYVLRQSTGYGVNVNNKQLADLDFADDIVLLEDAKDRLRLLFDEISEKAREVGLSINVDKSKSMSTSGSPLTLL